MPRTAAPALPLRHWCVLSLRPRGMHAGLRTAAARRGARTLALSQLAIAGRGDAATRESLAQALQRDMLLYTSPNAVRLAAALLPLRPRRGQSVLAVGSGTLRALQRQGVAACAPRRMDSEGLLAMPELADVARRRIGLVTGEGGRDLLAPALRRRGADVLRVEVYARVPLPLRAIALGRLRRALAEPRRVLLPLSSADALRQAQAALPADLREALPGVAVVAASARLADLARETGFRRIALASDARPASLLRAAADAFGE